MLCYDFVAISTGHQLENHHRTSASVSLRPSSCQNSKAAHLCVVCWGLHPQSCHGTGDRKCSPKDILVWWCTNPSEKYEFVSWDDYSQYTEKMFQTTNQHIYFSPKGMMFKFHQLSNIPFFHPKILLPDSLSWKKCTVSLPLFSQNERKTNVHHHSLTLYMFRSTLIIIIINIHWHYHYTNMNHH